MIKSISFIVLTQFFHFNQLKILRQPGFFIFFKLNQQYIFLQWFSKNTIYDGLWAIFFIVTKKCPNRSQHTHIHTKCAYSFSKKVITVNLNKLAKLKKIRQSVTSNFVIQQNIIHCKKIFSWFVITTFFQINLNNLCSSYNTIFWVSDD